MKAVQVTESAIQAAYSQYESLCRSVSTPVVCDITSFEKLFNGAMLLSLDRIEDSPIQVAFLVPPLKTDLSFLVNPKPKQWYSTEKYSSGGQFIRLPSIQLDEVNTASLKAHLRSTGDGASFLVLGLPAKEAFTLEGILFLPVPLAHMRAGNLSAALRRSLAISVNEQCVTVQCGERTVCTVRKGSVHLHVSSDYVDKVIAAHASLRSALLPRSYPADCDVTAIVAEVLREIIERIVALRHGATLVFNSPWSISDESRFHPGGIEAAIPLGKLIGLEAVRLWLGDTVHLCNDDELEAEAYNGVVGDQLVAAKRSIVNLSQNDGAMIFDDNLTCRGCGVFLKASGSAIGGGARHRSARSFVVTNPTSMALVISQDGNVSVVEAPAKLPANLPVEAGFPLSAS